MRNITAKRFFSAFTLFSVVMLLLVGLIPTSQAADSKYTKIQSPYTAPKVRIIVPQNIPTQSTPTVYNPPRPPAVNTQSRTPSQEVNQCTVAYDMGVNSSTSTVEYSANPLGFRVKVDLQNNGTNPATNVRFEVRNITTLQVIVTGIVGIIDPCTTGTVYDFVRQKGANGTPLVMAQGENRFSIQIIGYDQIRFDADSNNNRFETIVNVPFVDLSVTDPDYTATFETKLGHSLTVHNQGGTPSSAFKSSVELNGQLDTLLEYPSIAANGAETRGALGTNTPRSGYNLVRALVDSENQVREMNESQGQPETNNKLALELKIEGSQIAARIPYTASSSWFMYSPTVSSENNTVGITIPVLYFLENSASLNTRTTLSVFDNAECTGNAVKSTTPPAFNIGYNASRDLSISNFTNEELQALNGKTTCVQFAQGNQRLSRTLSFVFPDLVIENYGAEITTTQGGAMLRVLNYRGQNINLLQYLGIDKGLLHNVRIKNAGSAPVAGGTVSVSVFSNGTLDGTTQVVQPLAPDESLTVSIAPSTRVLKGFNIVKILVDSQNTVFETNEANNRGNFEVKVVNEGIVSGYPKIFTESQNFYMYQPAKEDFEGGTRKFIFTLVNISDATQDVQYRFDLFANDKERPDHFTTNPVTSWTSGMFKDFTTNPLNASTCYERIESFVSYAIRNGYGAGIADNIFEAFDISPETTCI